MRKKYRPVNLRGGTSSVEEMAAEAIEPIESAGAEYGNNHSDSDIQSIIDDYYDYLTDEQKQLVLEALGMAKSKEALVSDAKSNQKSPSSFKLISYDAIEPIYEEDKDSYMVCADMKYSSENLYGVELEREVNNCFADFEIDIENGTATVTDSEIMDYLLD